MRSIIAGAVAAAGIAAADHEGTSVGAAQQAIAKNWMTAEATLGLNRQ